MIVTGDTTQSNNIFTGSVTTQFQHGDFSMVNSEGQAVIIVAGDSRAVGLGATAGPTPNAGTVYEFDKDNDTVIEVGDSDLIDATNGSIWPQYGISFYEGENIKPVFVQVAQSSARLREIDANPNNFSVTGDHWSTIVEKGNLALAAINTTRVHHVVLVIGVNDAGTDSTATIIASYEDLIDRINTEFGTPTIYIAKDSSTYQQSMTYVELSLLNTYENVTWGFNLDALTAAGHLADNLHPDQSGNNKIGELLYRHFVYAKTMNKWESSFLSGFYDEVSLARRTLLRAFINWLVGEGILMTHIEQICFFKAETEINAYLGIGKLSASKNNTTPSLNATFNLNDSLQTNDASKEINLANLAWKYPYATQNDLLILVRQKTASLTDGKYLIRNNTEDLARTVGFRKNGSEIHYMVNDLGSSAATEVIADGVMGIQRISGNTSLIKNGVIVDTTSIASNGNYLYGQLLGQMGAKFEWAVITKANGVDMDELITQMDNVYNNW